MNNLILSLIRYFLFFISFVITTCTSSHSTKTFQNESDYRTLATSKFQGQFDVLFNSDSTYVLCSHSSKPTALNPKKSVSFFIYSLSEKKIVYEESIADGSVRWTSHNEVEILSKTGHMTSENESGVHLFIFNVSHHTKKQIDQNSRDQ